jgi:hypothetical protein
LWKLRVLASRGKREVGHCGRFGKEREARRRICRVAIALAVREKEGHGVEEKGEEAKGCKGEKARAEAA